MAANAGREHPTPFPWGGDANEAVPCERAILARGPFPFDNDCNKDSKHFGPLAVNAQGGPGGDLSLGLGVVNLAGNMIELTRDAFASFSSNCWASQPLTSPTCIADRAGAVADATGRGGGWFTALAFVGTRQPISAESTEAGFRCVRSGN